MFADNMVNYFTDVSATVLHIEYLEDQLDRFPVSSPGYSIIAEQLADLREAVSLSV